MCLDSLTHAMITVYVLCGNGEKHEYDHERHVLSKCSSHTIGKFSHTFHLRSPSSERTLSLHYHHPTYYLYLIYHSLSAEVFLFQSKNIKNRTENSLQ